MATLHDRLDSTSWVDRLFLPAVLAVAGGWCLLALLCWIYPAVLIRVMLVLLTGTVLLAGGVWYGVTRWAWHKGQVGLDRFHRPVALFLLGWLLSLGSSLASGFALRWETQPVPPPPVDRTKATPATTKPEGTAPVTGKLFARGPRRFLADMEEFDVKTAPDVPFMKNGKLNEKTAILVEGNLATKGLSVHPPDRGFSSVKYRLNDEAAVFKGKAGIDDTGAPFFAPGYFEVLGDGVTLWKSKELKHKEHPPEECKVSVEGVRVLELRYYSPSFKHGHHAVWVDPRVLQRADTPDE